MPISCPLNITERMCVRTTISNLQVNETLLCEIKRDSRLCDTINVDVKEAKECYF